LYNTLSKSWGALPPACQSWEGLEPPPSAAYGYSNNHACGPLEKHVHAWVDPEGMDCTSAPFQTGHVIG